MGINIVETLIRKTYGREAEGLPLNPTLGRVENLVFDANKPNKVSVEIWTGFHNGEVYLKKNTTMRVFLGVKTSRHDLTVKRGDYVQVTGVGFLGVKPRITAILEDDSRLAPLKQSLEWASDNPTLTLLDNR